MVILKFTRFKLIVLSVKPDSYERELIRKMKQQEKIPEITIKAVVLSIFLTVILSAANAYLGLKVGMTVSASIPAAVIAMACLRLFKHYNKLESNIVQTGVSSGAVLAAGVVFTIPAMIIIAFWTHFHYWQIAMISVIGGILGVLFSVPLRRVLLADNALPFPEGNAIGNILNASEAEGIGFKNLIYGSVIGATIKLFQLGFKIFADSVQIWFVRVGTVFGFGLGFDPALFGAGYIMGVNTAIAIMVGIVLGWVVGVPIIAGIFGVPELSDSSQIALALWSDYIRYIGLGVMMTGGVSAVYKLMIPIYRGIKTSFQSLCKRNNINGQSIARQEQDIPIHIVFWLVLLSLVPIYFILSHLSHAPQLQFSHGQQFLFNSVNLLYLLFGGFIFASICAYFAGLVGSSASPLSSLSLIALIFSALIMMAFLHDSLLASAHADMAKTAASIVIVITALVSSAAAISNDTIQDLKAGQIVGATPWKQQVMLMVGVVVAALIIPLVLQLLFNAYGMAGIFPRSGMDPSQMLLAPQASLMAAVVNGIFMHNLNWTLVFTGMAIGIVSLLADQWLKPKYQLPVLAVGIGIYLPVDTSSALVIGGVLSWIVRRALAKRSMLLPSKQQKKYRQRGHQYAMLLASGLVAGAAIMGIILAVPFVIEGTTSALQVMPKHMTHVAEMLGTIAIIVLCWWFKAQVQRESEAYNRSHPH